MTSKLFGQESQEQRESRLAALEQSIQEGEEAVKEKNAECQYVQHKFINYPCPSDFLHCLFCF